MSIHDTGAEWLDTSCAEYFATEVAQITKLGPVSRVTFVTSKTGSSGRMFRESVVAVVIPNGMLQALAVHIQTGIPTQAQGFTAWDGGEPEGKGH